VPDELGPSETLSARRAFLFADAFLLPAESLRLLGDASRCRQRGRLGGRDHFKRHSTDQQKNRLVKRLSELGYAVELKRLAA
jgi:hypothetical protein